MNPTELKTEEALSKIDDNLAPIEGGKVETPVDTSNPNPQGEPLPTDSDNTPVVPDAPGAGDVDEGLTAADLETKEETPEAPQAPQAQLDPETQYIVDNLPDITTVIKDGDGVKSVSVKSWTQLPPDVEFATKRDELAFMNALTAQENKAAQLQSEFRNNQAQEQTQAFEDRENAGIRQDITTLQNSGDLPKFKVNPDAPGFDDDPATKQVQEVLDFMNEKNQAYLDNYNSGGQYRHIGFAEAYQMMPKTQQEQVRKAAQKAEDQERTQVRVGGNTGEAPTGVVKPTVPRGTSLDQILERIEHEWQ